MPRYKLTIEYDGTPYCGWQIQSDRPSVHSVLKTACDEFVNAATEIYCAGRTDAGVHATGQVAHVDFPEARDSYVICRGLNAILLPHPVAIVAAEAVPDEFHARFDAVRRHYEYKIVNRPARLALDEKRAWHIRKDLDIGAMQEGANHLIGHHDFTTFRSGECQAKSPMKTLQTLSVSRANDVVTIRTSAKSFLHHQVRNMVGSLVYVGMGKWTPAGVKEALGARDRQAGGPMAPAHGLYFTKVDYEAK